MTFNQFVKIITESKTVRNDALIPSELFNSVYEIEKLTSNIVKYEINTLENITKELLNLLISVSHIDEYKIEYCDEMSFIQLKIDNIDIELDIKLIDNKLTIRFTYELRKTRYVFANKSIYVNEIKK